MMPEPVTRVFPHRGLLVAASTDRQYIPALDSLAESLTWLEFPGVGVESMAL